MCDTLIAGKQATSAGSGLFAKNSDRPPNEAQYLEWIPAAEHPAGSQLSCTYLEIPQAEKTHALLLSRPFWIWGGEMGVNEHGLAIGNEAVFSKVPANKEPALLGMDLLRLALERAKTAPQAVDVITALLEAYGQGGNCVQDGHLYYHNSFLIADPRESWVLETVDRHWAARRVDPLYSISNLLTMETRWDRSSAGLEAFILQNGYAKAGEQIHLADDLSDLIYTTFADGRNRCRRSGELMAADQGKITIQTMAGYLRDHGGSLDPRPGIAGADICMHASLGPIRGSQTTASLIADLEINSTLVLATGTAAPCTGIFKPVWIDAPLDLGKVPTSGYDPATLYWSHENLHREVLKNYQPRLNAFREQRDALEAEFIQGALERREASKEERQRYSQACFQQAAEAESGWLKTVQALPENQPLLHTAAWNGINKKAGML